MNFRKTSSVFTTLLFLLFLFWWVWIALTVPADGTMRNWYSITYGVLAAYGGILGMVIAKKYGGFKSYVGKALNFFAIGLLSQFLGQISYSIQYLIDHVENSYPSWGEIFFFASVPSYVLGVWFIGKAAGSISSLKSVGAKILAFVIPAAMLATSYYMFIAGSPVDGIPWLEVFLSFYYPLGQAFFVSLAIVAYILSGKVLGGVMKRRVVFLLFSLVFQYAADSMFLYKAIQGTWYQGDFSEFMFAVSYSLMTFAFLDFSVVFDELKGKS